MSDDRHSKAMYAKDDRVVRYKHWAYDISKTDRNDLGRVFIVSAEEAYKNKGHKFRCTACGKPVYARKSKYGYYFAHVKDTVANSDKLIESDGVHHQIVKDLIVERGLIIPSLKVGDVKSEYGNVFEVNELYKDKVIRSERLNKFESCIQEYMCESCNRIADIYGFIGGHPYIVEVTDTHGVTADKLNDLKKLNCRVVEVTIIKDKTKSVIERIETYWLFKDMIDRQLYQLLHIFCGHKSVKEPIARDADGNSIKSVCCIRKMENYTIEHGDEPYVKVNNQSKREVASVNKDCLGGCPRCFGIDHDKNGKDYLQCFYITGEQNRYYSTLDAIIKKIKAVLDIL